MYKNSRTAQLAILRSKIMAVQVLLDEIIYLESNHLFSGAELVVSSMSSQLENYEEILSDLAESYASLASPSRPIVS